MLLEKYGLALLLVALTTGLPSAVHAEKRKLAVMPLGATRVSEVTVGILDELVLSAVHRVGKYEVMGASDIRDMLGVEQTRQAMGCSDVSCVAEIAGALGVDLVVSGTVVKLGDKIIITLKLIDQAKTKTLERSEVSVDDSENLFAGAVDRAVGALLDPANLKARLAEEVSAQRSFNHTLGWIGAAGAAVFLGAGAAMLVTKPDPDAAYRDYKAANEPNDASAKYGDVESDVSKHNTRVYAGWALVGLGAAAAAFSIFEFVTAPSVEAEKSLDVAIIIGPAGPMVAVGGTF